MNPPSVTSLQDLPARLTEILARREAVTDVSEGAKPAAVLVPLQFHDGEWHVILNLRSDQVGEHKGEIAFPGGRLESIDRTMEECALRETHEEMGVRPENVNVIGPLDTILTRTNYAVWPTVGVLPHPCVYSIDAREVAQIIEVPLRCLMDPRNSRYEARLNYDGSIWNRQAFATDEYLIFGATAWILAQLVELVEPLLNAEATE